jgi:hypothetical protein
MNQSHQNNELNRNNQNNQNGRNKQNDRNRQHEEKELIGKGCLNIIEEVTHSKTNQKQLKNPCRLHGNHEWDECR